MWADNETTEDFLGFQVHADLIRSVVTDRKLLPVTIGLFGDWGSGKTSVMRMLERDLAREPESQDGKKVICLYFNSWLFEGYDDAKAAIIGNILSQLATHQKLATKIRKRAVSLLKSVNWMRVCSFVMKNVTPHAIAAVATGGASIPVSAAAFCAGITGKNEGDGDSTKKLKSSEDQEELPSLEDLIKSGAESAGPLEIRTFRERFSQLLKDSDISSLVVLIDDLDRCSPERIIHNLEAIKLFLNVDQTAFVIGADERIVRHAISTMYQTQEIAAEGMRSNSENSLVSDYLEKLIQVPYHIPRLSPSEVESYMTLLFCNKHIDASGQEKCKSAFCVSLKENRYSTFSYSAVKEALGCSTLPPDLDSSLHFCVNASPLITEGLKGNPRQVKRFLNAFVLRKQLAKVAHLDHIQDQILIKLMILEYSNPKCFEDLFDWQAVDQGYPEALRQLEEAHISKEEDGKDIPKSVVIPSGWDKPSIQKWIAMEPKLSQVDLRDYFWVARDRLQSTLSGVSFMSSLVRKLLEDLCSGNSGRFVQAVKRTQQMDAVELESLLQGLEKHIVLCPDEKKSYDGMFALMREGIPNAAECLSRALQVSDSAKIEPTIGPMLLKFLGEKPDLRKVFDPVIGKLRDTHTKISAALKPRDQLAR
jgi:hypothetical protein